MHNLSNFEWGDGIPDDYKPEKKLTDEEMEDNIKYLSNHPLFMTQIPDNIEDNEHLLAMQNIMYDDEPENIAKHCNVKFKNI